MFGRIFFRLFSTGLVILLFSEIGWGNQNIGMALDEAMKSRSIGTIEEVTQQFQQAVEKTGNPQQKASVLSLMADYLMEKQEWGKTIEVYERILTEGTENDKPGAYYGAAEAYLMLNQPEKAKAICVLLKTKYPNNPIEGFANFMREISPNSVHAKLAGFFVESPSEEPGKATVVTATNLPNPAKTTPDLMGGEEKLPTILLPTETKETKQPTTAAKLEENRLTVDFKGWHSGLSGHIDSRGMNLGLNNDAGFGAQTRLSLNGSWKFSGKDQLRFDYSQFDHTENLNKAVTFDKLLYGSGASVNVRTSFFDVGLSRVLNESEHGSWKFFYGVKFSRSFMRLAQQLAAGMRAGELNQNFGVPYLGFEGNTKLSDNVTLNGSLKYFSLNGSGASGRLTDFDVALLIGRDYAKEPAQTEWYGTLGYRFFLFHGEADNDSAEIRYSGPTFGLESRF